LRHGSFILEVSCARQWAYGVGELAHARQRMARSALYNQRRKDLINLDDDLGGLPVPQSATESILRQLVKKGLVERPIHTGQ
jgi:hypothetical protein